MNNALSCFIIFILQVLPDVPSTWQCQIWQYFCFSVCFSLRFCLHFGCQDLRHGRFPDLRRRCGAWLTRRAATGVTRHSVPSRPGENPWGPGDPGVDITSPSDTAPCSIFITNFRPEFRGIDSSAQQIACVSPFPHASLSVYAWAQCLSSWEEIPLQCQKTR